MLSSLQLQALVALCDAGSFDQAAKSLHVSTSALSQRITALEKATGFPLVQRGKPVTPTKEGERVLSLARATVLLHAETLADLHPETHEHPRIHLAVNADSLATWFTPVLDRVAREGRWLLELTIDDEAHTATVLSEGRASCAISTAAHTSAGAKVELLGSMRYRAVASPLLFERHGTRDPAFLPYIRFNARDHFQTRFLDLIGAESHPPFHTIPSHIDFLTAIELGLGWAMLPETQALERVNAGGLDLITINSTSSQAMPAYAEHSPTTRESEGKEGGGEEGAVGPHENASSAPAPPAPREAAPPIDVKLYWHRQRMASSTLDELSDMVRAAARAALER